MLGVSSKRCNPSASNHSDEEENWQVVSPPTRRQSPRKNRNEDRYARHGGLSPLRSPIRPEVLAPESPRRRRSRPNRDNREREPRPTTRTEECISDRCEGEDGKQQGRMCTRQSGPCWKRLEQENTSRPSDEIDFPSLDRLKFTPKKAKDCSDSNCATDWGSLMEQQDTNGESHRTPNRSKRRLPMSEENHRERDQRERNTRRNDRGRRTRNARPNRTSTSQKQETVPTLHPDHLEQDKLVLERRQKQIEYGKKTLGYEHYVDSVPGEMRMKTHPRTPNKFLKYSRRSWDAQVKIWRRQLHIYDPSGQHTPSDGMSDTISDTTSECSLEVPPPHSSGGGGAEGGTRDGCSPHGDIAPPNTQEDEDDELMDDTEDLMDQALLPLVGSSATDAKHSALLNKESLSMREAMTCLSNLAY